MIAEKVNLKEIIGGRYDNSYVLFHHRLLSYKFSSSPLQKFLIGKPQYGANEASISRESNEVPRYIRITDIDENGCLADNLGATAKNVESKYILKNNDILIARSGNTVGKSYIHKTETVNETCFFAGYLIRFVIDSNLILPDYVFIFTKLSVFANWVKVTQRVTGQPNINAEEYSNLPIPVPPIEVQRKIIEIYQNAQKARLNKIDEAKQLLDGIEDYIANKLQLNTIRKRGEKHQPFTLKSTSLFGSRFDVQFHAGIKDAIRQTEEVPYKALGEIAAFSSEGWNQKSIFNDKFPYIEISSINTTVGCIEDISSVSLNNPPSRAKKIVRRDDILISTTRPNRGAICIYDCDNISIASTGFSVIRETDNCVRKEYLYLALRLSSSLEQMSLRCSGGNYPAITESELKKILIPIPSITIQEDIIETVAKTRNIASQLQEQGNQLMETAKQKIENIILG